MRARAAFSDPSEVMVTIVLNAPLRAFEELQGSLRDSSVPFYQAQSLLEQISDAARKLRRTVDGEPTAARRMVEGDI